MHDNTRESILNIDTNNSLFRLAKHRGTMVDGDEEVYHSAYFGPLVV